MRFYKQHRVEFQLPYVSARDAVLETAVTGWDLFLNNVLDLVFILLPFIPGLYTKAFGIDSRFVGVFFLINLILYLLMIIFIGRTPGMIVTGTRYASTLEYRIFTISDFFKNIQGISFGLRKTSLHYESFQIWNDRYHQSDSMKEKGVLLVNKRMFKLFLEDFANNGKLDDPILDNIESKILHTDATPIFRENDE